VPERMWASTPVHLLTTAGLRMLSPEDAQAILQQCSQMLANSGFLFRHALRPCACARMCVSAPI